ncbi:hypothetical protein [Actinoplanes palleronii]|uniref:Antibiotic biosynthesis monooxygenase n=1 Tax=Actinoplanes palleronii TaxID=113570 RepID=A0ABQ4BNU3_9ACTN|nr:hypothetical protein [Actinoplanes palleronii]GIE72330.1 hypothetical protein Apa02nite_084380 [Actinoplanes palleronii]
MMVLVSITLAADGEPISTVLLIDTVWSVTRPEDRLEHLSARTGADCVHLGMFIRTASADEALVTAHEIWLRAATMSTTLQCLRNVSAASLRTIDIADRSFAKRQDI